MKGGRSAEEMRCKEPEVRVITEHMEHSHQTVNKQDRPRSNPNLKSMKDSRERNLHSPGGFTFTESLSLHLVAIQQCWKTMLLPLSFDLNSSILVHWSL